MKCGKKKYFLFYFPLRKAVPIYHSYLYRCQSHGMLRDFSSIPYTVTEIIRFISQQNSFHSQECWWTNSSLSAWCSMPQKIPNPGNQDCRLQHQCGSKSLVCFVSSFIICDLKAKGLSCSRFVWLQWDPDPGVLLFRSAAVLMHYHANENETGPCVRLSKGQKGCKAHLTENLQVSYRKKMQLTPQISSDSG